MEEGSSDARASAPSALQPPQSSARGDPEPSTQQAAPRRTGQGDLLIFERLRRTAMGETPFRWTRTPNPIRRDLWPELIDAFPAEGWFTKIGADRILIGPVINQRLGFEGPLPVAPVWERVIRAFCSAGYRAAMKSLTGLDLDNDILQFNFNRYSAGDWSRPHLDSPNNRVVHLLYFNTEWPGAWGGQLAILDDEDPAKLYENVAPSLSSSVVMIPSANSWHMVTPVARIAPQARLSLKITFLKPEAFEADLYGFYRAHGIAIHRV